MTKGIIFYTDNETPPKIAWEVQFRLKTIAKERNLPIVCASLKRRSGFGDTNIYFPSLERGQLTLYTQILSALEHSTADTIFFCEADILYHPSHFDFTPPTNDAYYYDINNWVIWINETIATHVDINIPLSMLCGNRELLTGHYRRKIARVMERRRAMEAAGQPLRNQGVSRQMSAEPGGEGRGEKVDNIPILTWASEWPNLDLRHGHNLTKGKRRPTDYRNRRWAIGWKEAKEIPGWGKVSDIVKALT
jgi:hypothetical protein